MVWVASDVEGSGAAARSSNRLARAPVLPWTIALVVLSSLAAAWIAAGSTGLLGHPLRRALTWVALGIAVLSDSAGRRRSPKCWLILLYL